MRGAHRGFILFAAMAFLAGVLALNAVALSRAIGELNASNRYVASLQAFHLAESGIDCAVEQLRATNSPTSATIQAACAVALAPWGTLSLPSVTPQSANQFAVTSRGSVSTVGTQRLVSAVLLTSPLLRHFFLANGPAYLTGGQGMLLDAGAGPMYIAGNLELSPGGSTILADRIAKELTLTTGSTIEVDGYVYDRRNPASFATLANITLKGKIFPENDPMQPIDTQARLSDWVDFLRNPPGPDLTGVVTERGTGARPITTVFPDLQDIDAYALSFQARSPQYTVNAASDLPCAAGSGVQFANTKTRAMVSAVEIDVSSLNGCLSQPTLIYATVPVRLTNAQELAQPLTIVSDGAVYLKGDFNTIATKSAAVVTRNRVYPLSRTYVDYGAFYPTPVAGVPLDLAAYTAYKTAFNAAPASLKPAPPIAGWHAQYAEDTTQRVSIVAPVQPNSKDNLLNQNTGLLEDWYQAPGYQWAGQPAYLPPGKLADTRRRVLRLSGAFIQLTDTNPGDNDQKSPSVVDNRWIFNEPQHETRYDTALTNPSPPGFNEVRVLLWRNDQ